jgi:hypothetical protein
MDKILQVLARWRQRLERAQQAQREAYLEGASDIYELERRMRDLERNRFGLI